MPTSPFRGLSVFILFLATLLPNAAHALRDADVTAAVENELFYDHAVSANNIITSTDRGVVTLRGSVSNLLAKERAVRIAETVKGVRSVVDLIKVVPGKRATDGEIAQAIEQALLEDPATDSYEVSVKVQDRHATLTGTVDSWDEKSLSEKIAKGVRGLTKVTNKITISYTSKRPDREIEAEIAQALRWNNLVDDGLIDVQAKNGAVKLTGTVGSAAERRQARLTAWTSGVQSVDDSGLEVERWARDDDLRRDKYLSKTDEEIRKAVQAAMLRDPRVAAFNVTPSVAGGSVRLHGVVENLRAKRAAEQDARHTVGVHTVKNYLKVRPADQRDDMAIEDDIRAAFGRDPYVERYEAAVSVYGGMAYLSGTMDSHFERSRADELASRIEGVVAVVNRIHVDPSRPDPADPWVDPLGLYRDTWLSHRPYLSMKEDLQIKKDIESELFWSPFVDSDAVSVAVDLGVATLSGTVDSYMEKQAALDNAYEGGAVHVRNKIEVDRSWDESRARAGEGYVVGVQQLL